MKSTKRVRILGLLAAFALVAAACNGADPTTTTAAPPPTPTQPPGGTPTTMGPMVWEPLYEGTLQIGSVLPQTGGLAVIGPAISEPIKMAIAEAAEAGNTFVALSEKDRGTDAQIANVSVDELLNEGVSVILGPAGTDVSLAVIDKITQAQVPMCSPSNTGAVFTTYDDNGFYFRTAPPDNLQGAVHGDMITDDGATSVAILYQGTTYGRGLAEAIKARLEDNGVSVPEFIEFDPLATSFDAEAAQAAAAGVDAISIHGYAELNLVVQSLIEAGVGPDVVQLYGGDGFPDSVQAETVEPGNPAVLEGVRVTYPSLAPPDGEPTFGDRFAAFAPDTPTIFSAHSFDCATIMILAAEAAGSTDPVAIAAAVNDVTRGGEKCSSYATCHALLQAGVDIDYDGASGPLDFVDAGEPGAGAYTLQTYLADGKTQTDATVSIP